MRILVIEDDSISRKIMKSAFLDYGECDLTVDGIEGLEAYLIAVKEESPYDLICIDIMMPKLDGIKVLKSIRELEEKSEVQEEKKSKIIMTTALNDMKTIQEAFDIGCNAYAAKPIDIQKLHDVVEKLGFVKKT